MTKSKSEVTVGYIIEAGLIEGLFTAHRLGFDRLAFAAGRVVRTLDEAGYQIVRKPRAGREPSFMEALQARDRLDALKDTARMEAEAAMDLQDEEAGW